MQPQGSPVPTQTPTAPNPIMMALLKARAAQGATGGQVPPAPNGMNNPGMPPPPQRPVVNMPGRTGGASPTQQLLKTATTAQSPLMDDGTRQIAKTLIQKLMQHM